MTMCPDPTEIVLARIYAATPEARFTAGTWHSSWHP